MPPANFHTALYKNQTHVCAAYTCATANWTEGKTLAVVCSQNFETRRVKEVR